jgi:hypothetical protein
MQVSLKENGLQFFLNKVWTRDLNQAMPSKIPFVRLPETGEGYNNERQRFCCSVYPYALYSIPI